MTNEEINRKVAELRGFTIRETQEECSAFTPGATWVSGGDYYEQTVTWCIPNAYVEAFDNCDDPHADMDWFQYCGVPDYCGDPAAWGALLIEIAGEGREARVGVSLLGKWSAVVSMRPAIADTPGRALCLAYIAASEVTK